MPEGGTIVNWSDAEKREIQDLIRVSTGTVIPLPPSTADAAANQLYQLLRDFRDNLDGRVTAVWANDWQQVNVSLAVQNGLRSDIISHLTSIC